MKTKLSLLAALSVIVMVGCKSPQSTDTASQPTAATEHQMPDAVPMPTPTPPKDMGLVGKWNFPHPDKRVISDSIVYDKDGSWKESKEMQSQKSGKATLTVVGTYSYDGKNYTTKSYVTTITGDPKFQAVFDNTSRKTNQFTSNAPETTGTAKWKGKDHVTIDTITPAHDQIQQVEGLTVLDRAK
jgi:hypothetical protein